MRLSPGMALWLLCSVAFGQDASPTTDWSSFDPAAALAAGSEPPKALSFDRLWTTQHRVKLLHGLAISADGKRLLALATDGRCQVYDGESGRVLTTISEHLPKITHAALSADGSHGAVGLATREVVTFDTANGKVLRRYQPPEEPKAAPGSERKRLLVLQFTADGKHVAWLASDARFERAEISTGNRIGHTFFNERLRFGVISEDGLVATCEPDIHKNMLTYLVLPAPGSSEQPAMLDRNYVGAPVALVLSQNFMAYQTVRGQFVVQSHLHKDPSDGRHKISTSNNLLTASRTGGAHLAMSSDEKWILAVGRGQVEIRRIDLPSYPSLHHADFTSAAQIAIAPDALRIAVIDQDGRLAVLGLSETPDLPLWTLQNTIMKLLREEQFELVEKLSEAMQDDPEPFPGDPASPKHHAFMDRMLRTDGWDPSADNGRWLEQWWAARPDTKIARLLMVQRLISQGWAARGSGLANTVTPEGWEIFHQKANEAHLVMDKLLAEERPPPEAFLSLFEIAKAESWSEEECMEQAKRVSALSPQYLTPHLGMVEKLLMRWGGHQHSSALYSAWVSDKVGGPAGDAMYAQLIERIAAYEDATLLADLLGIDWERAFKGCEALQDMPQRRPFGVLLEMHFARILNDKQRLARVARIIDEERTPFVPEVRLTRFGFDTIYREHVDLVVPAMPKPGSRNAARSTNRIQ